MRKKRVKQMDENITLEVKNEPIIEDEDLGVFGDLPYDMSIIYMDKTGCQIRSISPQDTRYKEILEIVNREVQVE